MTRKEPDPPLENDSLRGGRGGLKHNPFRALRGLKGDAPAPEASPPTAPILPTRSAPPPARAAAQASAQAARPNARTSPVVASERVTVRRERAGRGGKTVTLAEGPGLAGLDLAALAREAARDLGVGARVEDAALVVQGDQSERLATWLVSRGFPSVVRGN